MNDIETFIRDAAQKRGIDPDIAVRVCMSEGGITEYARRGTFPTGSSWWPTQLHYGGPGYEQLGTTAGMGTGFTALTGWQPGDPRAWRDAIRFGFNHAKRRGWSPWFGAAHVGVGDWDGIDRNHAWDAQSERWDFEREGEPAVPRVTYDPTFPATIQDDSWSCAPSSLDWALRALGRSPGHSYIENLLLKDGIVSREQGLLVATGGPLAAWIGKKVPADVYYGAEGFYGNNEASITWDAFIPEINPNPPYPIMLGGRNWGGPSLGHWSGVRGYDQARGVILLANPAGSGPKFGGSEMTRAQWDDKGPFSLVRVLHDDLLAVVPPVTPPPAPSRQRVLIGEIRDRLAELEALAPA